MCTCRLEDEVASLESHLDGMRSVYAINADKLEYNYCVLGACGVASTRGTRLEGCRPWLHAR